jgi:hypothetical protein
MAGAGDRSKYGLIPQLEREMSGDSLLNNRPGPARRVLLSDVEHRTRRIFVLLERTEVR